MGCKDCAAASTDPIWPIYRAGCRGCQARALANGPAFFESATAKRITPTYRAALMAVFGDAWEAGHRQVRAEFERLRAMKNEGVPCSSG